MTLALGRAKDRWFGDKMTERLVKMMDNHMLVICQRGLNTTIQSNSGQYQGLLGSTDTLDHSLILHAFIEKARDDKLISNRQAAKLLVLIDDFVLTLNISRKHTNTEQLVMRARNLLD